MDVDRTREDRMDKLATRATCDECGRTFDLMDEVESNEWHYGHDCES